jgi:hypothetical protein
MSHAKLVKLAEHWLRRYYRCGIVLSEQTADSGEVPDVIGWKAHCHSILVECKVSRADFLADRFKWARLDAESGMGCERLYLTPKRLLKAEDLPSGWGLLECDREGVKLVIKPSRQDLRTLTGMMAEMHLYSQACAE